MNDFESFSATPETKIPSTNNRGCFIASIIGGVLAGLVVVSLICCGGLMYFGLRTHSAAMNRELRDNVVIKAQLGEPIEADIDFAATAANGEGGYQVFDVRGSKGSGQVDLQIDPENPYKIIGGQLRLESGETIPLFPEEAPEDVPEATDPVQADAPESAT